MSSRKPKKMRGPSRPINPRYAPGPAQRRGPDMFGFALIGISGVAVLVLLLFLAAQQRPAAQPTPVAQNPADPAAASAAQTQQAVTFATETANLPVISAAEAKALFNAGDATFVDVRVTESYQAQHIKGAANIPYTEASSRTAEFPTTGNLILYCQ